ncbi:2-hydroxyacid dehydrogenase [Ichthyenterobacterium sp. W332]|uniref:2-hydroxyacid dehydrogenase n=1 Tax=Microcosmobacter mediterraneus TaxID=3075607 RepID=A0ABU2YKS9_9FLAO|nr:2-hydroxyacid dehydrogenase [Ichthyenterobacterium sp. W332]MDT0557845.1 2-hydroxyacid dehydrogenase [Ichthyenterobacterium sp. W332]
MKILHLDTNHELLLNQLNDLGFTNDEDYTSSKEAIETKISDYDGIVIRSRFSIDKQFLDSATNLKFIGRVGAGLENIDCKYAEEKGVTLFNAPEGNRNAVGEHSLAMLLSLFNKLNKADKEVRQGQWNREANRGVELDGKTIGLIGYGNMGKAFAKKLRGFDVEVLCYDIKNNVGDENAKQVSLEELQEKADVLSLHTPQTPLTLNMVNTDFINAFKKSFWLINTARGKSVVTDHLVLALKSGKILGAGLDVLEYEKSSFEDLFKTIVTSSVVTERSRSAVERSQLGLDFARPDMKPKLPEAFQYLINSDNVILSPHVAGWTIESKEKLAQTIVDKIKAKFC